MKYDESIQRSVDYIDQHLMEKLDLEQIASQSGYSLSHFYKVFPAVTGFSIKEFVRNKRLAESAKRLVNTHDRILDISLECGFESQEVFTRAFSSLYGATPAKFRSSRKGQFEKYASMDHFARLMIERSQIPNFDIPVRAEVIQRGWMHLVGMEMTTTISANIDHLTIPRFWENTFIPRLGEISGWVTRHTVIAYEVQTPGSDDLLHLACVETVTPAPPPGMTARSLEPGYYAAFTPARMLDPLEYSALVRFIYGEWFPMSGREIRADYSLDLYSDYPSRDGQTRVNQLTVLIPILPPRKAESLKFMSPYSLSQKHKPFSYKK